MVTPRFKSLIAFWFVLQIVLPFTPPLQTCELKDLLGTQEHKHIPASPESSTTPTPENESESDANLFVSPLAVATLSASASLVVACEAVASAFVTIAFALPSSPHVQQTVLRL